MRFKIGDYVEGYSTSDKRMLITYTKGWVVKAEYTGRKLVNLMINEDVDMIREKYADNKEIDLQKDLTDNSINLVVDDERYTINKVKYLPDWGRRNSKISEHIDDMKLETQAIPYHIDESLLRIKGTFKIFRLDGVLQVPNSGYTDIFYGDKCCCRPVDKMIEYIEKYTLEDRRLLMIDTDLWTPRDLQSYADENIAWPISDLFRGRMLGVSDYEDKALRVDDVANENKNMDCVVIDNDIRLVTAIQNRKLFRDQARNLKAVHSSMIMDMV